MADYFRTRFSLLVFGPVAVALSAIATTSETVDLTALAATVAAALVLLFQLRLLDDLLDRERDRRRGLKRVLVEAISIQPFVIVLAVVGTLTLGGLATFRGPVRVGLYVGLVVILIAGAMSASLRRFPLAYACVPTAKYPAIIVLLATPDRWPPAPVLLFIYALFVLYELLHDLECRAATGWQAAVAAGSGLALGAVFFLGETP